MSVTNAVRDKKIEAIDIGNVLEYSIDCSTYPT